MQIDLDLNDLPESVRFSVKFKWQVRPGTLLIVDGTQHPIWIGLVLGPIWEEAPHCLLSRVLVIYEDKNIITTWLHRPYILERCQLKDIKIASDPILSGDEDVFVKFKSR